MYKTDLKTLMAILSENGHEIAAEELEEKDINEDDIEIVEIDIQPEEDGDQTYMIIFEFNIFTKSTVIFGDMSSDEMTTGWAPRNPHLKHQPLPERCKPKCLKKPQSD